MTTSPSLVSLEEAGMKLSLDDSGTSPSSVKAVDDEGTICSSEHFVPADCIPTVQPSRRPDSDTNPENEIHILDVLLTAIQNPTSQSWVKQLGNP